ncbi:hypothetical protein ACIRBY_25600 [Streptomyces sp. NPDC096136]|uniref:hypothetical protein n=1 Tax=Streptomyces sp. NPDC096136 TaxID=3366076 RepID=UPI0038082A38
MNDLGDARVRTWTLRLMTLLAADVEEQLAWVGEREVETQDVVEEAELLCRVCEGLAERGVLTPVELRDLRPVGRRLAEIDAASRAGLWAHALTGTDPAWDDVRLRSRQFLLTALGDPRRPLPRYVPPRPRDR